MTKEQTSKAEEMAEEKEVQPQEEQTTATADEQDTPTEEQPEVDPIDELVTKIDELNNNYLRLHAEFDNYRKRTIKEKAELIKSGGERVLLEVISLTDDLERGLSSAKQAESKEAVMEGMDLIHSKFISFLEKNGIKEIEVIGLPFDAEKSEAITTIPAPQEDQKGLVIDCIQKGYMMHDKIIRFPKVIVGE